MLVGQVYHRSRVLDSSHHLAPVPDDSRVGEQPLQVVLAVGGHPVHLETVEGPLEVGPLLTDHLSAKPGLEDRLG